MFITKNAHRPTLTVAINFGKIATSTVRDKLYSVEAITKHIGYDVRTVKELKNEIEKILSNKKMLITADWKNRLPKDNELAKNYVVLFNIEKISNKKHKNVGTTAYIYVVDRRYITKMEQGDKNFKATINPKAVIPDYREKSESKVFEFTENGVRSYVKSKTEAALHSARTGLEYKSITVVITEDGKVFPADTEITNFIAVNIYSETLHFEKTKLEADKKFGEKNVFKTKVEGIRNQLFFNTDVGLLKKGIYKISSPDEDKVLFVEEISSFSGNVRNYHIVDKNDKRISKIKNVEIFEKL